MSAPDTVLVAIGTKKGLWLATSRDRATWALSGPHFLMNEIPSIGIDTRAGRTRILVGVRSEHWGPTVAHSDDLGATWTEPDHGAIRFGDGDGAALERVVAAPARHGRPSGRRVGGVRTHLGVAVGRRRRAFRPRTWAVGPSAPPRVGSRIWRCRSASVAPHPVDENTVHVAMSTGGVCRTTDGGASWEPRNTGITAYFLPDPNPELGRCVHKIARDAVVPDRLYAQNHHGVYRSDDSGDTWKSIADGLPTDFGFVMLTHPRREGTIWVVPIEADGKRIPPDGRLAVYRSEDAGNSWTRLDSGLPERDYNVVLRDAAAVDTADPVGVYFGTRGGEVYGSADEGASFGTVAAHLPDVLCVRAAVIAS